MIIAKQKRQENIAEYLLYLWQVEDLLRACNLDIDKVEKAVIGRYDVDDKTRSEIKDWYESLIKMMELENVRERGHIRVCHNVLIRLNDLHMQLLANQDRFPDYHADYYRTLPFIVQSRAGTSQRTGNLLQRVVWRDDAAPAGQGDFTRHCSCHQPDLPLHRHACRLLQAR